MGNKYKLVRVDVETKSTVQPINEKGEEYLDTLCSFENNEDYYYAIYENIGDEQDECWSEYDYYEQDFERAVGEYKKLIGKNNEKNNL